MKQKKYNASCPECNKVFEHDKELVVKQMLGYHRKKAHGISGMSAKDRRVASREAYWRKTGCTEAEIIQRRAKYEAKQSAAPTAEGLVRNKPQRREAEPIGLKECPCCGARFFVTKGHNEE